MKNAIDYFRSRGLLAEVHPHGMRFRIEPAHYELRAEPAGLTILEGKQLLESETFDEVLEVRVRLNNSCTYMGEDIEALLDNMLGEAIAKKFGLDAERNDNAQFLCAKVASPKQADNFAEAVTFYDQIANSITYGILQGRTKAQQQALREAMKTGLAELVDKK